MSDTPTTTLPDEVGSPRRAPGSPGGGARTRTDLKVAAAAFVALTGIPGLLYLAGLRAPAIDNRAPTEPPPLRSVLALDDDALSQLQDHLGEAVPGRGLAVRADAWSDLNLVGRSPAAAVAVGKDGWLFLNDTLDVPCDYAEAVADVRAEMQRAGELVTSTGRTWVTAVAPDKATLYRDQVGDDVDLGCFEAFSDAVQTRIEDDPPTGYVPTWDALRQARDRGGAPTYHVHDTHWTSEGSSVFALSLVEAAAPGLTDDVVVERLPDEDHVGDLTSLYGYPAARPERRVQIVRPGVEGSVRPGAAGVPGTPNDLVEGELTLLEASGGEVVDGRTVLWHDSFGEVLLPHLAPFFQRAVGLRKLALARPFVSDELAAADTIVYETVQRGLVPRWTEGHIAAQLAWAFRDELETRQVPVGEDGWIPVDPARFDVVAIENALLDADTRGTPLRLQLRGATGYPPAPQGDRDDDAPLVYDLSRLPDVTHVRVATNEGDLVEVAYLIQIATGTTPR